MPSDVLLEKTWVAFLQRHQHRFLRGARFLQLSQRDANAEGVLQFFGMRSDESYVFFPCFHFYYSCIFNAFALAGRKADCAYTQGVTLG